MFFRNRAGIVFCFENAFHHDDMRVFPESCTELEVRDSSLPNCAL